MSVFSTREIVTIVYISALLIWVLKNKDLRIKFYRVIKAASSKWLVLPFIILMVYSYFIVYYFSLFPIWNWKYLKDIVIWVILVGLPTYFGAVSKKIEKHYFRNLIFRNIGLVALVEFFTGTFTFNIWIEFFIQPFILFFILLQLVAGMKDENKSVEKIVSWIVALTGFIILGFTIKVAITSYITLNAFDLVVSFSIPIILTVIFLPLTYCFAVYAKYHYLFAIIELKESSKGIKRTCHKIILISKCKLSYNKICRLISVCNTNKYLMLEETEFRKRLFSLADL